MVKYEKFAHRNAWVMNQLREFGKKAVGAMRHFGFRPVNGTPMPTEVTGRFTAQPWNRRGAQRFDGGMGVPCDTS
eukprot:10973869-Alexandrium_andersonii.AAC.1